MRNSLTAESAEGTESERNIEEKKEVLKKIFVLVIAILNDLRNYCRGNPPVVAPIDRG
jgi:hypothetical protein